LCFTPSLLVLFGHAEFPARPLLYENLAEVVQSGWELDGAVTAALQSSTADEALLEELSGKVRILQ
jgi:hypothetical protein